LLDIELLYHRIYPFYILVLMVALSLTMCANLSFSPNQIEASISITVTTLGICQATGFVGSFHDWIAYSFP
jgi:hypothetical protein